jgi:hypothetical protein
MIYIDKNDSNINKPSTYGAGLPFTAWASPHGVHPKAATVYVPWGTFPPAGVPHWVPVFPVVPIVESGVLDL